jgi:hypothetical protein
MRTKKNIALSTPSLFVVLIREALIFEGLDTVKNPSEYKGNTVKHQGNTVKKHQENNSPIWHVE